MLHNNNLLNLIYHWKIRHINSILSHLILSFFILFLWVYKPKIRINSIKTTKYVMSSLWPPNIPNAMIIMEDSFLITMLKINFFKWFSRTFLIIIMELTSVHVMAGSEMILWAGKTAKLSVLTHFLSIRKLSSQEVKIL